MNKMFNIPFAVLLLACCMQNLDAGGCQRNQPPAQPTAPSCPRQYKPRPTTPATLEDENAAISASLRGAVNGLISGFDKLESDLDNFLVGGTEFTMGYKTLKDAAVVSGNSPASLQLKLNLDQYVDFLWRVIDDINRSGDSQAAQRNIDIITNLRSAVNKLEQTVPNLAQKLKLNLDQYVNFLWRVIDDINRSGDSQAALQNIDIITKNIDIITNLRSAVNKLGQTVPNLAQKLESGLDKLKSGLDKFTTNYKTLRNAANALGDSQASLQLKSALYRYVDFHKRVIDEISLLGNSQAAQQQAVPAE